MPHIDSSVVIRARMSRVFDVITQPDEFARYCKHIVKVVPLGNGTHHWEVNLADLTLEWDSVISERRRPKKLAWHSVMGIENSGSYSLERTKRGTIVKCELDYHLPSRILEEVAAPVLEPLLQGAVREVLEGIKARLEEATPANT